MTSGADSGKFGTIIRDGRDGMHDGLYKVKLATGKCTAYLEERRVWSIEKKKFTEEQWKSFGINDLRREHVIKSSDGCYFRPDLASGLLLWELSAPRKPKLGVELTNSQLSEALKLKRGFTTDEWQRFGISDLQQDHFIKSGSSYYRPFEVPEGFMPAAERNEKPPLLRRLSSQKNARSSAVLPGANGRPQEVRV